MSRATVSLPDATRSIRFHFEAVLAGIDQIGRVAISVAAEGPEAASLVAIHQIADQLRTDFDRLKEAVLAEVIP